MVAALLHLQKGSRPALKAVDQMGRGRLEVGRRRGWGAVARREQLCAVVEHAIDFGHLGVALGGEFGGAPGDDDRRLGMPAASPADCLAGLPLGFRGDSAGIDDDGAREPGRRRGAANDLGFERVQPAPEGDDFVAIHDRLNARR